MNIFVNNIPWWSSFKIAGSYGLVGVLWVLFSDRVLYLLVSSEPQRTFIHSVKGIGFIALSSLLIFVLSGQALRRRRKTEQKLEVALEQAERLHRILRHNLRNSCQVISGITELLNEQVEADNGEMLTTIQGENDRLIRLSRKSVYLRDFLDINTDHRTNEDLVDSVQSQVELARENHPTATISTDCPAQAQVHAHKYIGQAVEELIDNAIRHNDSAEPCVHISVQKDHDSVSLTVTDNGPGIPRVEQLVLERKTETPTEHSQGLGLWLIYLTVRDSNGTLTVNNRDGSGAEIQFTVPAA